jgi:arylsulfatase A-like enzyme
LLILYTDDQGIGDVGCYGQPEVRTPHIDALARGGVRFTQWYSNAPICSASRAALLTGKYPERTGVTGALLSSATRDIPGLRAGETTLAGELRAAGYRTAVIGKWHLGSVPHSRPTAQGFDEFFGWYSGWLDAYSHRYYRLGGTPSHIFHDLWRNDTEVFEEPAYMTELLGREALAFLNRQTLAKPFFLYLAFGAPHYAMMSPRKYQDRFPASMPRDRREHLAMVAAIDDVVGAILRTLERRRRLRDTIIFFASDNGATREERASHLGGPYDGGSNRPFRGWKQGLFEGGIRVPAILHAPTYLPPRVCEEVGIMMDILPTFLTLAERPVAPDVDGANLWPALRGEATWPRRPLFWAFSKSRALRDSDWKLLVNPPRHPGDPPPPRLWLSDLRDDPGELRNRVPEESERAARMERQIEEWGRSVGLS